MGRIKEFYKPNLLKISFSALCVGVLWGWILPRSAILNIIPCRIAQLNLEWGLCPVNPTLMEGTIYLGNHFSDAYVYPLLYLALFLIIIPYTLSCLIFKLYYDYIKKLLSKQDL